MTKLSNTGAGKPITALWQLKNRDVVYERGSVLVNGAWEAGTSGELFSFENTSNVFFSDIGRYTTEILYYDGCIWLNSCNSTSISDYFSKIDSSGNQSAVNLTGMLQSEGMLCIAIDDVNGCIYLDSGHSIKKYKLNGPYSGDYMGVLGGSGSGWGGAGTGFKEFSNPSDLILNTNITYIFVYNYLDLPVDLNKYPIWWNSGWNNPEPWQTEPMWDYNDEYNKIYLHIVDGGNYRIVKTEFDGTGWTTIGAYKDPSTGYEDFKFAAHPKKIVEITDKNYFIVSEEEHLKDGVRYISLIKFKFDGSYWERINFPKGIGDYHLNGSIYNNMIYRDGVLYIADGGGNRVIKTDPDFTTWKALVFNPSSDNYYPCGIALDPFGDLYIHDWNRMTIYKTSYFNS